MTRVQSLDLLRGLDVFLMLFVNEMAGVHGTPGFLRHMPSGADGMTITDVVFPAFLFITGMAIPLALDGRLRRGEPRARVWRHVLIRTASLLIIGMFMVNGEYAGPGGLLSPAVWNVLMPVGVLLIWRMSTNPRHPSPPAPSPQGEGVFPDPASNRWAAVAIGVVLLVFLAAVYRSEDLAAELIQFRPRWWGILGLIGWAYGVAAGAYLLAGRRPFALLGITTLLYCLCLADQAGHVWWLAVLRPVVSAGSMLGSHAALTLSGTMLTVLLVRHREEGQPAAAFVRPALAYAVGLAVAGLLLHSLNGLDRAFWINKVQATVPWCLLSGAITAAVWAVLFVLVDVKGWTRWPKAVTLAGENALLAYLMAPLFLSLFAIGAAVSGGVNPYRALGHNTVVGVIRSALFAWLIVRLCGWMRARGLRVAL